MVAFASQEKVAAGFKAAGERIDAIDSRSQEIEELAKQLQGQLKRLYQTIHSASASPLNTEGRFGIWLNEKQAEEFGRYVLAAIRRQKDMSGIVATGGGVLVGDELVTRFVDLLPKYGKFRQNVLVLPIESGSALVPKIETDMTVYCPEEGGTINNSNPTFSQLKLVPKTWAALAKVSNELDEDAVIAIGVILGVSIARSMAKQEDLVGFLGDGTSAYFGHKGIVGAFHSISETISEIVGLKVATGNAYGEITLQDFEDTAALLPEDFDEAAKWYVSKKFYHKVMRKLAASEGIANMFDVLSNQKARYFLGYQVEFVSCMPSTEANSQICAILGDLSAGAYLAQRKGLTLAQSGDVYFANNQLGVRGIERVDVNVFGCGDKTNPGPIVGLITAAA